MLKFCATAAVAATLLLGGCSSVPGARGPAPAVAADLLTGKRVFDRPVTPDEVPAAEPLAVSPAMREFLRLEVGQSSFATTRFERLVRAMHREGYFRGSYDADQTRTAAETFDLRAGNCLSFTNLFVALARALDIDARFQIVAVPPDWDADSGFLIRYTHINVLVAGVHLDRRAGTDEFTMDFNAVHPDPDYARFRVSDRYAHALYYGNRSVQSLRDDRFRESLAYLQRALALEPGNPDLWINVGAFYAKMGDQRSAVEAFEAVLQIDPGNKSALGGLARAHRRLGNVARAEGFEAEIRRYRERNPFYHFALAQSYYERERFDRALAAVDRALALRGRNARFHFLKALTLQRLGDPSGAQAHFDRASRLGDYRDLKQRYINDLAGVTVVLP